MTERARHIGPFAHDSLVAPPERQVLCVHYDDCLDKAVRANWRSWACLDCEVYEEIDAERKRYDMFSLLRLQCEVENPSKHRGQGDPEE